MSKDHPKQGDRYVVVTEFTAAVLTHWFAPRTGGDRRPLPAGLEFIVAADPPPNATAISCRPDPAARWETLLVNEQERTDALYGGYPLVIPFADLAANCSRA